MRTGLNFKYVEDLSIAKKHGDHVLVFETDAVAEKLRFALRVIQLRPISVPSVQFHVYVENVVPPSSA